MQRQTNLKPMIEGGILAAIAILFAFVSAYVPILGGLVHLIWPVPIVLLGVRHGYKWSIMATVVAGFLIAILMHPLHAISVVVGFGLIGIVLGYAIKKEMSAPKIMLVASIAAIISQAAIIGLGIIITGVNPLNMSDSVFTQSVEQTMGIYKSMGIGTETLSQMESQMDQMVKLFKIILPAGFILAGIITAYVNFIASKLVLKRLGTKVGDFPPFKEWQLPMVIGYLFVVSLLAIYWGSSREIELLYNVGMNMQMVTMILILIQGLALFYYLADKYNISKLLRGLLLFFIFTSGFAMQAIIVMGITDMAMDFRKLRQRKSVDN